MATQVNSGPSVRVLQDVQAIFFNITLITSGTTVTVTLPAGTRIIGHLFHNTTTDAFSTGGTYDEATGVYVSPTMAVNDVARITFLVLPF